MRGSGADDCGEAIGFLVGPVDDDDAADSLDQYRVVLGAKLLREFALAGFVQRRDAQLEQFVMIQRRIDFLVQVFRQAFLTYDDDRLEFEPMAFGA